MFLPTAPPSPLHIGGAAVELLGSTENLTWSNNTSCLVKKAHQRPYFLRRLRPAGVGSSVLSFTDVQWRVFSAPASQCGLLHHERLHPSHTHSLCSPPAGGWGGEKNLRLRNSFYPKTVDFRWSPLRPPAASYHRLHQFNLQHGTEALHFNATSGYICFYEYSLHTYIFIALYIKLVF